MKTGSTLCNFLRLQSVYIEGFTVQGVVLYLVQCFPVKTKQV